MLLSIIKEEVINAGNNGGESQKYYVKWKNPDIKEYIFII